MLRKPDKIPEIQPSLKMAKEEWSRFQIEVYLKTKEILGSKACVIFSPSITDKERRLRTRPDCLILWGSGTQIQGLVAVNATIKYHLDDIKTRIERLRMLKTITECPLSLSSLFYSNPDEGYPCYDCSACWRPFFIPFIVTKEPYEGVSYCLVDGKYHLVDFDTFQTILNDFDEIKNHEFPNQLIINKHMPKSCTSCGKPLHLVTIWTCPYVNSYFIQGCDHPYEEVDHGKWIYRHEVCCKKVCPEYVDCLKKEEIGFICFNCGTCFTTDDKHVDICVDCEYELVI